MKALDVPVHNVWGLRPTAIEGTKEIAPLTAYRELDGLHLLDNVTTLNFHPHLPHDELTARPAQRFAFSAANSSTPIGRTRSPTPATPLSTS